MADFIFNPEAWKSLRELDDGRDGLLNQLLEVFKRDAPLTAELMRKHLASGDANGLEDEAHKFKSGAANIGAENLRDLSVALENFAKANQLEAATRALPEFEAEVQRALAELRNLPGG